LPLSDKLLPQGCFIPFGTMISRVENFLEVDDDNKSGRRTKKNLGKWYKLWLALIYLTFTAEVPHLTLRSVG